jgi:hypothetical protein
MASLTRAMTPASPETLPAVTPAAPIWGRAAGFFPWQLDNATFPAPVPQGES